MSDLETLCAFLVFLMLVSAPAFAVVLALTFVAYYAFTPLAAFLWGGWRRGMPDDRGGDEQNHCGEPEGGPR